MIVQLRRTPTQTALRHLCFTACPRTCVLQSSDDTRCNFALGLSPQRRWENAPCVCAVKPNRDLSAKGRLRSCRREKSLWLHSHSQVEVITLYSSLLPPHCMHSTVLLARSIRCVILEETVQLCDVYCKLQWDKGRQTQK